MEIAGGTSAKTTNNRMEMRAAPEGLRVLKRSSRVTIVVDSNCVWKGMTQWITNWSRSRWRCRGMQIPNQDLWLVLIQTAFEYECRWSWTKGHAGQPENERCDLLATSMIGRSNGERNHRRRHPRKGRLRNVKGQPTAPVWLA